MRFRALRVAAAKVVALSAAARPQSPTAKSPAVSVGRDSSTGGETCSTSMPS